MCGRFGLVDPDGLARRGCLGVLDISDIASDVPDPHPPRYNIAPSQPVLAVVQRTGSANGAEHAEGGAHLTGSGPERRLEMLRWGLVPSWAKDPSIGNSLANARSESVHEKPSFRSSFTKGRRCLVPADVYYEWQPVPAGAPRGAKKQPYAIGMRDGAPFMFAALWEFWRPRPTDGTPAGEPIVSCALLTTGPNAVMAPIHDRMPVILPPGAWETWLDPRTPVDALRALLIPYDAQAMRAWPVSTRVNSPRNDDASCVASMTAGEA